MTFRSPEAPPLAATQATDDIPPLGERGIERCGVNAAVPAVSGGREQRERLTERPKQFRR
jgi:hypothetical protein